MQIQVSEIIDRSPVGALQIRVVLLCALVALIDGFDIQAMALVTPIVAADWGVPASSFGPVLSSSFAGIMVGAMTGGVLGDRIGRRGVLVAALVLVGVASLLTARAGGMSDLMLLRCLTGVGIGACMPNFTALTAEYTPSSRTAFFVTLMYSAVPLGGVLGGYIAPGIIDAHGWRSVFLLGGALPLAIAILLLAALPESIRFQATRKTDHAKVGARLRQVDPTYAYDASHDFVASAAPKGGSLPSLFSDGRAAVTLLLWLVFFFSLFGMYLLTSWLPSVFAAQGWARAAALQSASNFQLGGIVGGVILGVLIDRFGAYRVLAPTFLAAAVFTALVGAWQGSLVQTMGLVAMSGFAIVGAQLGMTALAAGIYPTWARATGVGWALGVGRAGAVISPFVGGLALAAEWSHPALFAAAAVAPLLCAIAVLLLWAAVRRQARRAS
ncbi:MAG: MFS transporter [Hyphomonadaceae bacterium]|nr:MFS transporter [Hyphomonadaceae bacterium]